MSTHIGESFKCDLCQFSTAKKSNLMRHMRNHTGKKLFKCDLCHFSTTWKSCLVSHKRTHTGEKPFKCDVCHFSTAWKSCLASHTKTHTGEKRFMCSICQFSSTWKRCIVRHMKIHRREISVKNTDHQSYTHNRFFSKKHINNVNSNLQRTDEESIHLKIDQSLDLDNSVSVKVQLSSDEHQIKEVNLVKIKEESQDDGVQRWIVIK